MLHSVMPVALAELELAPTLLREIETFHFPDPEDGSFVQRLRSAMLASQQLWQNSRRMGLDGSCTRLRCSSLDARGGGRVSNAD